MSERRTQVAPPTASIWKFVIGSDEAFKDPDNPDIAYTGYVSAIVATSERAARDELAAYHVAEGLNAGWLRVARVLRIPIEPGKVIVWASLGSGNPL